MKIDVKEVESKEPKPKIVALAIPESLRQKLRQEAYESEMSFSATIRRILEAHFASCERTKDGN